MELKLTADPYDPCNFTDKELICSALDGIGEELYLILAPQLLAAQVADRVLSGALEYLVQNRGNIKAAIKAAKQVGGRKDATTSKAIHSLLKELQANSAQAVK